METYSISQPSTVYIFDSKIRNCCVKIQSHEWRSPSDGSEEYYSSSFSVQ